MPRKKKEPGPMVLVTDRVVYEPARRTTKGLKRNETISNGAENGAYVQVFQRPDEEALADLTFFNGNRNLQQLVGLRDLISEAIQRLLDWKKEDNAKG